MRKAAIAVRKTVRNLQLATNEFFYRMPNPLVKLRQRFTPPTPEMRLAVDKFRREGIVALPNYLQGERLQHLQESFGRTMAAIEAAPLSPEKLTPYGGRLHPQTPYHEQGYSPESRIIFTNDPFKHDPGFLELALDEFILEVIGRYIGKRFMLQQAVAARYYPNEKNEFGSWQWHHDSWGRKINVMFLLTDVDENDQYMTYLKRSHLMYHHYDNWVLRDRFSQDEIQNFSLAEVKCLCTAGTVFIFDANGFHRGNRSLGASRDSLITQYTAGRYLWSFDIPKKFTEGLSKFQQAILNNNPNIKYI